MLRLLRESYPADKRMQKQPVRKRQFFQSDPKKQTSFQPYLAHCLVRASLLKEILWLQFKGLEINPVPKPARLLRADLAERYDTAPLLPDEADFSHRKSPKVTQLFFLEYAISADNLEEIANNFVLPLIDHAVKNMGRFRRYSAKRTKFARLMADIKELLKFEGLPNEKVQEELQVKLQEKFTQVITLCLTPRMWGSVTSSGQACVQWLNDFIVKLAQKNQIVLEGSFWHPIAYADLRKQYGKPENLRLWWFSSPPPTQNVAKPSVQYQFALPTYTK